MKQKKYIVKGTPIVPSLCAIGMAVLWYLFFYFSNGKWGFDLNTFSFEGLESVQIYLSVMTLVIPVLFFICVLFLAELDLKWMILSLLAPVVYQVSLFIIYLKQDFSEYIFENPVKFVAPFLALILFIFTVEKVIPTKWVFVGFCGAAVLLPLILTFCGIGEFTYSYQSYAEDYSLVTVTAYLWSELISYALYYVALAALVIQMRPPRESDFVTMKDLQQAYAEKMAAQNEGETENSETVSEEPTAEEPETVSNEEDKEDFEEDTESVSDDG